MLICNRSPSPEPIYNTEGKRLNTREYRVRKRLEEERHTLIQIASLRNPEYKPPIDYRYMFFLEKSTLQSGIEGGGNK